MVENQADEEMFNPAALTHTPNLVRLELIGISFSALEYEEISLSLGIQELILIDCEYGEGYLLCGDRPFPSLRILHIEETILESQLPMQVGCVYEDSAPKCCQGIGSALRQPQLEQVSGNSKFLAPCISAAPQRWRKSFCDGSAISEFSRYTDGLQLKIWVRQ